MSENKIAVALLALVVVVVIAVATVVGVTHSGSKSNTSSGALTSFELSILEFVGSEADGAEVNSCWDIGETVIDRDTGDRNPVMKCSIRWGRSAARTAGTGFQERCFDMTSNGSPELVGGGECEYP